MMNVFDFLFFSHIFLGVSVSYSLSLSLWNDEHFVWRVMRDVGCQYAEFDIDAEGSGGFGVHADDRRWLDRVFVRSTSGAVRKNGGVDQRPHVMAKIEKPSCFEADSLESIVELCDGIMVARGDLGVECAPEDVPILQKQIIDECRDQGKPVVVATQMLESMIESSTPTRAKASDITTAIYHGGDAMMLSAESAAGSFPEESVRLEEVPLVLQQLRNKLLTGKLEITKLKLYKII